MLIINKDKNILTRLKWSILKNLFNHEKNI